VFDLLIVLGTSVANCLQPMTPKPDQSKTSTSSLRPARKILKGQTETSRLFLDVDEMARKTQRMPLTRYVE
jgi:hypothetical protein